jgi:hypothetical protein
MATSAGRSAPTARDRRLLGKVLKQMQRRPEIDLSHVDVSVEHGVVHLAGSVRSQLERIVMGSPRGRSRVCAKSKTAPRSSRCGPRPP